MNDKFIDALRKGRIKGTTRIIMEDIATRRRIIREDSNMITSALQKVFDTNVNGMMDINSMIPIMNILGGCFMFWDELTESADNIFPPSQLTNKLTAHAGQTSHSTSSRTRGNPNGVASYVDAANGQVRFAWDWSLEQGNGQISCVCLTHPQAADCGLYPDGSLPLLKTFGRAVLNTSIIDTRTAGGTTYDEARSKVVPMYIDANGDGHCVFVSGNSFKENIVRHPWVRTSLIEAVPFSDTDNYTVVSTRTATLSRSFTAEYFMIGQDDSYYYVMERDSSTNTKLYVNIISKSDMSVSAQTIDISGATLARPQMRMNMVNNGIVSGGYIYWPSAADAKTFVRINIQTPADTDVLTSYLTGNLDFHTQPISRTSGLILGRNFLINGDYVYPVTNRSGRSADSNRYDNYESNDSSAIFNKSPLIVQDATAYNDATYNYISNGGVLYLPALYSINNLSQPVTKTEQRTMRCEYTLTVVSGGS